MTGIKVPFQVIHELKQALSLVSTNPYLAAIVLQEVINWLESEPADAELVSAAARRNPWIPKSEPEPMKPEPPPNHQPAKPPTVVAVLDKPERVFTSDGRVFRRRLAEMSLSCVDGHAWISLKTYAELTSAPQCPVCSKRPLTWTATKWKWVEESVYDRLSSPG